MNFWRLIQKITNKVFPSAGIKQIIQLTQGRINYIYRVVFDNFSVNSVIIRIRYMNDERFLQGFYCEKWVNEYLHGSDHIMPEVYYADDSDDFGIAYMVCEDIVGETFNNNTDSRYIYHAGEILACIHQNETDFIGKYTQNLNIDAGIYYDNFFKSVLQQLKKINYILYCSIAEILDRHYKAEYYDNYKAVILHHDFHMQNLMIRENDKKVFVIDWDSARSGMSEVDFIKAKYLFTDKISEEKKKSFFKGYLNVDNINITSNYPIQELIWLCRMYMFEKEQPLKEKQTFYPPVEYYYNEILKAISDYDEYSEKCYKYFSI